MFTFVESNDPVEFGFTNGLLKLGWLNALKASARNCSRWVSDQGNLKDFSNAKSITVQAVRIGNSVEARR